MEGLAGKGSNRLRGRIYNPRASILIHIVKLKGGYSEFAIVFVHHKKCSFWVWPQQSFIKDGVITAARFGNRIYWHRAGYCSSVKLIKYRLPFKQLNESLNSGICGCEIDWLWHACIRRIRPHHSVNLTENSGITRDIGSNYWTLHLQCASSIKINHVCL